MNETGQEPLIGLEHVSKTYHMGQVDVHALKAVELDIARGEFIVVLGPSGSGKTTLLNLIGGIDSPTEGRVIVDGVDITDFDEGRLTEYRRERVGFIFQFFNLIPTLTARENVEFAAELVGYRRDVEEILAAVGLAERADHFPSELSGGEQQRVAIARALAKDPSVLLCDEPTGELDFETGRRIMGLVRDLNQREAKTVVMVTHNTAMAAVADRVVRLRSGEIGEIRVNEAPIDPAKLHW